MLYMDYMVLFVFETDEPTNQPKEFHRGFLQIIAIELLRKLPIVEESEGLLLCS
jgi:hypothetical protein